MERTGKVMKKARAFTLVEVLIVVVLLGILAGVIVPMVSASVMSARESALSQDLNMLRRYVLVYKGQHREVAPGYPGGDITQAPTEQVFVDQMMLSSNAQGQTAPVGTADFPRGPYLERVPVNPLSGKDSVEVLADGTSFPADGDGSHGWIYKPETGEVKADLQGAGDNGTRYYDY